MIDVHAGRFDPVTNGHLDIVRLAARTFERVIVAVYDTPDDKTLFPTSKTPTGEELRGRHRALRRAMAAARQRPGHDA